MTNYLLLFSIVLGVGVQNIAKKFFNKKVIGGTYLFNAVSIFFALIFFVITMKNPIFSTEYLIYSFIFALSYITAGVFSFLAIKEGSLSLSSLIISYSLLVPSAYGLIFQNEKFTLFLLMGLTLLIISLFLINFENKNEKPQITFKWLIYITLAFLGNGFCSTVQRIQQIKCEGKFKNEFMVVALLISFLVFMVLTFLYDRKDLLINVKKGFISCFICGISNGVVNLFVIILSLSMAASVMFPIISAGGIIFSAITAIFLFKEKLSKLQYLGLVIGIISVIFLNI